MRFAYLVAPLVAVSLLPAQGTGVTLVNGVDGYIEIPYAPQTVPQSGLTFEAWITYDDTTLGPGYRWPTVARQNPAPGAEAWFLRVGAANINNKNLHFKVKTAGGDVDVVWTFTSGQLQSWTHVACTYDGAMAYLYVAGQQVGSALGTGLPPRDQGGTLRIGKGDPAGLAVEVWNGSIDEVRLWPFARTPGQIQSTMNWELHSIPGLVSTWNLNNSYGDTSGSLQGTPIGSVPFTANPLSLTPLAVVPAVTFGASTQGCNGPIEISLASLPRVGNQDFAVTATRLPGNGLAIGFLGFQSLPTPLTVVGVNVFVDPTSAMWSLVSADPLGSVQYSLPIPSTVVIGQLFAVQIGALDPCGPVGWTASNALGSSVF